MSVATNDADEIIIIVYLCACACACARACVGVARRRVDEWRKGEAKGRVASNERKNVFQRRG